MSGNMQSGQGRRELTSENDNIPLLTNMSDF